MLVGELLSLIGHERWQDIVLSAGNIFCCLTLVPMLRHPIRPPLLTCIPTAVALLLGGFVFATVHLWLTALTQTVQGLQWLALALKKLHPSVSWGPEAEVSDRVMTAWPSARAMQGGQPRGWRRDLQRYQKPRHDANMPGSIA
jgi:hypothetical protein